MPKLNFGQKKSAKEIDEVFNFNPKAFADTNFSWTPENLKQQLKDGWAVYSADVSGEIVAVLFMKVDKGSLLTKNTPIKFNQQGNGYSHEIKEFYEDYAKDNKITTILNYVPFDNFRMVSLNERHGYEATGVTTDEGTFQEWVKKL